MLHWTQPPGYPTMTCAMSSQTPCRPITPVITGSYEHTLIVYLVDDITQCLDWHHTRNMVNVCTKNTVHVLPVPAHSQTPAQIHQLCKKSNSAILVQIIFSTERLCCPKSYLYSHETYWCVNKHITVYAKDFILYSYMIHYMKAETVVFPMVPITQFWKLSTTDSFC